MVKAKNDADLAAALRLVQRSLAPASIDALEGALAALSVQVMRRDTGDFEASLTLAAYVDRLTGYPADVAMQALREWPTRSKFWPTWFELEQICEGLARRRRHILAAIEAAREWPRQSSARFEYRDDVRDGLRSLARQLRRTEVT